MSEFYQSQTVAERRATARMLTASRVLFALVEAMKDEFGDGAQGFYESHLSLGTGMALRELAESETLPSDFIRLDEALPGMVKDLFQRAEAVLEAGANQVQA